MRTVFDLTEAEARLAARLGSGQALDEIAHELRLSKETVRAQLKSVFAKTNTHRQSELAALLSRL
ncbi:MAG: helix-turn-helix transcriptional regulator [Bradyrhizobium sp.]|nr:helix-turn-helix transcriptional regulator [Bradyrhizobium sp.]